MSGRIAIFLPSLHGGGAERVMLTLAESFVKRGLECDIVIAISQGELLGSVPEGVRLVELRKKKTIRALFTLVAYLKNERPTALLSTVFTANITALMANIMSRTGTRLVTCEASPTDIDMIAPTKLQTFLNRLAARILYRYADATIAVSGGVRDGLLGHNLIGSDRIHVIPNPAPSLQFGPGARGSVALSRTVLACGRLEPQKDHATLLRAFSKLKDITDLRLVILGDGSLRASLEELARQLGIAERVHFAGFDPNPYEQMRAASVFVHTARYEGFGVVLLEALACGCPIIAMDGPGGVREVLAGGKYGALLTVGDEISLANTIRAVLNDEMRFADPADHLQQFALNRVSEAYLALLLPSGTR
jgi:glycosyltransferase involved in cell wall biosynthesis